MKIVVLDGYTLNPGDNPWDAVAALGEFKVFDRTPADLIVERAKDADILLTNKTPISRETLAALPKLKYVSILATGFNIVDIAACRERRIPVSNVPVYGTDTVAQYVFALLLELCHRPAHHSERVMDGEWARRGDFCFWDYPLIELRGLTMALVGFGRIGRRTGELAAAFGMNVLAVDVVRGTPPSHPVQWVSMEEAFARGDVVSLHCPLTPDNEKFVNAGLLAQMKSSAFLINTSRGQLVDEQALADALNRNVLAGAAVDVVSAEPIRQTNPLLRAKNVLITPHMAWGTLAARRRLMETTVENVKAFLSGKPVNIVNG